MRALRWLGLLLLSLLLALVLLVAHTWWFKPLRLNWFYNRVFLQSLLDSPISLSSLQLLDGRALDWYSGRWDDFSIAHEDQEIERAHLNSVVFQSYDAAPLTGPDKVSWQVADFQNFSRPKNRTISDFLCSHRSLRGRFGDADQVIFPSQYIYRRAHQTDRQRDA